MGVTTDVYSSYFPDSWIITLYIAVLILFLPTSPNTTAIYVFLRLYMYEVLLLVDEGIFDEHEGAVP